VNKSSVATLSVTLCCDPTGM